MSAAATSSFVESGLLAASATSAPPAASVRIRLAVSVVTWRQAAMRRPAQRPLARESLADEAQDGHLALGPLDPADALVGEAEVGDVVGRQGGRVVIAGGISGRWTGRQAAGGPPIMPEARRSAVATEEPPDRSGQRAHQPAAATARWMSRSSKRTCSW